MGWYQWEAATPPNFPLRNPIYDYTLHGVPGECPLLVSLCNLSYYEILIQQRELWVRVMQFQPREDWLCSFSPHSPKMLPIYFIQVLVTTHPWVAKTFFSTSKSPFLFPARLCDTINPKSTLVFHSVFAPPVPNLFHDGHVYYIRECSTFYRAHIDLAATCFTFKYGSELDQIHSQRSDGQDLSNLMEVISNGIGKLLCLANWC